MTPGDPLPPWASVSSSMQGGPEGLSSSHQRTCPPPPTPGVRRAQEGAHGQSSQARTPRGTEGVCHHDHVLLESSTAQVFPWLTWRSRILLAHISWDLFLAVAGLMWCGRRVPLLIWALKPAEVWMVIMSMDPFMETGPEKVSNEN